MPRVTQAHVDARHRQILTAAHRCFARRGLHATTIQEIADEAGLSAGALYRYFDGKEALIEAIADWGRKIKQEALEELSDGGGTEALAQAVEAIIEPLEADSSETEAALRLDIRLWGEALDQPAIRRLFRQQMDALKDPIVTFVRSERKAGRIRREVDPEAVAETVVALLVGLELQKAFDPELDVARYARTIGSLLRSLG
ncbi:MAG: TetR/AcrR family transcriptional regulator [Vicinamibacteria bacterium]